jgi:hypothetical protein
MPAIYYYNDPRRQAFLDYVTAMNRKADIKHYEEEERRRRRQQQTAAVGLGLAGAGVGAIAAGGMAGGLSAGQGALIGGRMGLGVGGRVGQGDYAGAALEGLQAYGDIQAMPELQRRGVSPAEITASVLGGRGTGRFFDRLREEEFALERDEARQQAIAERQAAYAQALAERQEARFRQKMEAEGYVLKYTDTDRNRLANIHDQWSTVETQYAQGMLDVEQYRDAVEQLGTMEAALKKRWQFAPPKFDPAKSFQTTTHVDENGIRWSHTERGGWKPNPIDPPDTEPTVKDMQAALKEARQRWADTHLDPEARISEEDLRTGRDAVLDEWFPRSAAAQARAEAAEQRMQQLKQMQLPPMAQAGANVYGLPPGLTAAGGPTPAGPSVLGPEAQQGIAQAAAPAPPTPGEAAFAELQSILVEQDSLGADADDPGTWTADALSRAKDAARVLVAGLAEKRDAVGLDERDLEQLRFLKKIRDARPSR